MFPYFLYSNILSYPACLPFIAGISLSGSILNHVQKVPEPCDWNGTGYTLTGSLPFVSKCPGAVHTSQVMVFPLNLPSDNQVLTIVCYRNQHICIVACLLCRGWKKCAPSLSVPFGWGSAIFFHLSVF